MKLPVIPIFTFILPYSRDRLVFSKSLLRRFLRDCLDRDSSLASPWTVKPSIARRFGLATEIPGKIKAEIERARKGEIDKRKRVWEEKELQAEREGKVTKKMQRRAEQERKGMYVSNEGSHSLTFLTLACVPNTSTNQRLRKLLKPKRRLVRRRTRLLQALRSKPTRLLLNDRRRRRRKGWLQRKQS